MEQFYKEVTQVLKFKSVQNQTSKHWTFLLSIAHVLLNMNDNYALRFANQML